jgi:hypothetical protein
MELFEMLAYSAGFNPAAVDPFNIFVEEFNDLIAAIRRNRNVDLIVIGAHLNTEANHIRLAGHTVARSTKHVPTRNELLGRADAHDLCPAVSAFLERAIESVPPTSVAAYSEQVARGLGVPTY